ncbi:B12-binding domain-containing radical SAM protein [Desulfobacula phenolica]|uniref:Radical SAM superfamily enzyme YgiQ, UPF0313 family n=1 Tax=Desulfobacula phenolica TaxID=90732 RepID=A0A1H2DS17_9BACT|nr:radical SAM protein [Desulfobacula phenolica]SDT85574.1 Radical SAM superfamily enzyme YgiQ, UPF0313 family [Desulfobacula phenolica]
MKLLLIEPNIEGRVGEPPFNIALLKSYIKEKSSHEAKILDLTFKKKNWRKAISEEMNSTDYDLVGITCLIFNFWQALSVAEFIKNNFGTKIMFGGVHPILAPEEVISNDCIDIVCIGEGEQTLLELLDNDLECENLAGIYYKKDGEIVKNSQRKLIEDLDALPFADWDDFDLKRYFKVNVNHMSIMASRGCPYNCTYCCSHALRKTLEGKWVRFRSAENVIEEVKYRIDRFYDKGLRFFQFNDDTFIADKKFAFKFCELYKKHGFHKKILWTANVRANLVDDDIIKEMKSAGCYEAGMGVESGDDYIRNKVYKRNMSMEQIMNAVNTIRKHGLQLHVPIILGAPYDTVEIMENNIKLAKKINAECTLFPVLMPLPKTEIRDICVKEGLIEDDNFQESHAMHTKPVMKTKYVGSKGVGKIVKKARRYLISKYFFEGLKLKGPFFLWDLFLFFVYYKPTLKLEIDNAWKFTIHKYNLARHQKERGIHNPLQ